MPYQIDFWLAADRPVLLARVRLINPNPETVPVYWWSNIAVPESPDVRVLVPATSAINTQYNVGLRLAQIPINESRDVTYPTNSPVAADYFFRIPENHRRWITALNGEGRGLVQDVDRLAARTQIIQLGHESRWTPMATVPQRPRRPLH